MTTENNANANPLSALATDMAQELLGNLKQQDSNPAFILLADQLNPDSPPSITFAETDPVLASLLSILVDAFGHLTPEDKVVMALVFVGFDSSLVARCSMSYKRKAAADTLLDLVKDHLEREQSALNAQRGQA